MGLFLAGQRRAHGRPFIVWILRPGGWPTVDFETWPLKGHPGAQPIAFLLSLPRAQREQIEKEKLEQEKKAAGSLQHANELRRQVRENQQKHVQNRLSTFEEGRRLKEEAQKRRERINDIKKQKLEELRCTGFLSFSNRLADWKSHDCGRRSLVGGFPA